jgi:protein-S-isoprenylcysteine O-methyltransferase Ste14
MGKIIASIYGLAAYLFFLAVFLYSIGFVTNLLVPKSIDFGTEGDPIPSLLINALLLGIFAVQHSVMARPGFKAWWTKIVPPAVERSTYVMLTNLALILLYWKWQPMKGMIWDVEGSTAGLLLWGLSAIGWLIVLMSTFAINHFDLFGLRQVYLNLRGEKYTDLPFTNTGLYKLVRHPIMLGFIIAFWATPRMTFGHLFFAVMTTGYILIALVLEERDLIAYLGDEYKKYQKQVPMILPFLRKK